MNANDLLAELAAELAGFTDYTDAVDRINGDLRGGSIRARYLTRANAIAGGQDATSPRTFRTICDRKIAELAPRHEDGWTSLPISTN